MGDPSAYGSFAPAHYLKQYLPKYSSEAEITAKEDESQSLEADLCNPEVLRDGRKVKQVMASLDQVKSDLARLYDHWEESVELN